MRKYSIDVIRELWGSMIVEELNDKGRALVADDKRRYCLLFQVGVDEFVLYPLPLTQLEFDF